MDKSLVRISKFLSFVLRHRPDEIGLRLDENGWANVAELITRADANGMRFSLEDINQVVAENDKVEGLPSIRIAKRQMPPRRLPSRRTVKHLNSQWPTTHN